MERLRKSMLDRDRKARAKDIERWKERERESERQREGERANQHLIDVDVEM